MVAINFHYFAKNILVSEFYSLIFIGQDPITRVWELAITHIRINFSPLKLIVSSQIYFIEVVDFITESSEDFLGFMPVTYYKESNILLPENQLVIEGFYFSLFKINSA